MPLLAVYGIGPRWPGGAADPAQSPACRRRHECLWNRTECAIGACWTRYLASRRGRHDNPPSSGRSRYDCGGLTGGERCCCRSELPQSQQHSKQPAYGRTHSGGLSAPATVVGKPHCCSVVTVNTSNTVQLLTFYGSRQPYSFTSRAISIIKT